VYHLMIKASNAVGSAPSEEVVFCKCILVRC
jgi:hypothetical protein